MDSQFPSSESNEESWMSVSDLMAGLMIVFLFVAITFVKAVGQEQEMLETKICQDIKKALEEVSWREHVEICGDQIVVKFKDPDTLFNLGKSDLKPRFKEILTEFFPLYMGVIIRYRSEIDELRIEGHTDDIGPRGTALDKYFYNIGLSQERTRSVMQFLFGTPVASKNEKWLIRHMTANGLSSSNPVFNPDNTLNRPSSRRVEFRLRLKTPKRLREIAEAFAWN